VGRLTSALPTEDEEKLRSLPERKVPSGFQIDIVPEKVASCAFIVTVMPEVPENVTSVCWPGTSTEKVFDSPAVVGVIVPPVLSLAS